MKFFFYGLDKPGFRLYSMRKSILSFVVQANQIFQFLGFLNPLQTKQSISLRNNVKQNRRVVQRILEVFQDFVK